MARSPVSKGKLKKQDGTDERRVLLLRRWLPVPYTKDKAEKDFALIRREEILAISVPANETRVLKHFQARMPYGLVVPDVA
jgi:hypothetical protein